MKVLLQTHRSIRLSILAREGDGFCCVCSANFSPSNLSLSLDGEVEAVLVGMHQTIDLWHRATGQVVCL